MYPFWKKSKSAMETIGKILKSGYSCLYDEVKYPLFTYLKKVKAK